jgi:hypothetical protein
MQPGQENSSWKDSILSHIQLSDAAYDIAARCSRNTKRRVVNTLTGRLGTRCPVQPVSAGDVCWVEQALRDAEDVPQPITNGDPDDASSVDVDAAVADDVAKDGEAEIDERCELRMSLED